MRANRRDVNEAEDTSRYRTRGPDLYGSMHRLPTPRGLRAFLYRLFALNHADTPAAETPKPPLFMKRRLFVDSTVLRSLSHAVFCTVLGLEFSIVSCPTAALEPYARSMPASAGSALVDRFPVQHTAGREQEWKRSSQMISCTTRVQTCAT